MFSKLAQSSIKAVMTPTY
ncbi:hypothetical protein [Escherichia coli]|nr:hypothetical protein [Escherichia coli]MBO9227304.1 hypothetical protein [Escherichia coli]